MSVTEVLQSLGSWELRLKPTTPDYIVTQLEFFGHVAIVDGPVPDVASVGNALLAGARYVGVCRDKDHPDEYVRGGSGLVYWLGDEDGKGPVILTEISLTDATLAQVVTALKPATVTTGTVFAQADPAARYTGKHVFQTRREALTTALAPFGAEVRVNPDFSIDVGAPSQLYAAAVPDTIIARKESGSDPDLTAIGGDFDTSGSAVDYSTDVTLLGSTIGTGGEPDTVFATGSAAAPVVPWKDPQGNQLRITRLISESGQTTGSVAARAQLQINRFNRQTSSVKVTAEDFEIQGTFVVGDATYVFDPDSGIVNPALEVFFHGQKLNPDIVRVTGRTWPIVEGMTVAWRTDAGVWLDLTPWVVWETTGQHELTVGDLPKTLFKNGQPNAAVQDRVDAARGNPSTKVPKAPTGLALSTASSPNAQGWDAAVITASWNPVTQYTDSTSVALSHYEVQYRPTFRSPAWTASFVTDASPADLLVTAALGYDVQVRAVSTGGIASAWSSTVSIVSAADSTGPATPSDPVVTQYLGLLRIYWNGLNSVGGPMPSDFNRVDVHVGTSSGFTASAATLVSSLSAAGYAHAQAPYSTTDNRWVRFLAYDHNGNPSASSAVVAGHTVQAADGDIAALSVGKLTAGTISADVVMAGRFATALTGARREVNAVGFQAFDASNNLLINLDGVNNLLTGIFQTALAGSRRIVIGAAGALGEIDFYAPDGTLAYVRAYTESTGVEAMQMGIPKTGGDVFWNKIHFNTDEWMNLHANKLDLMYLNGGFFNVRQLSARSGGTAVSRLQIDNSGFTVRDQANTVRLTVASDIVSRFSDGSTAQWLDDNAGVHRFYTRPSLGYIEIIAGVSSGGGASPGLKLLSSPYLGNTYGATLKYYIDGSGARLEVRNVLDSGFERVWAAGFDVQSERSTKSGIADLTPARALELVDGMRTRTYQTKRGKPQHGKYGPGDDMPGLPHVPDVFDDRIGLVIDEAPPEIVVGSEESGRAIDLYSLTTINTGSIQAIVSVLRDAGLMPARKGLKK